MLAQFIKENGACNHCCHGTMSQRAAHVQAAASQINLLLLESCAASLLRVENDCAMVHPTGFKHKTKTACVTKHGKLRATEDTKTVWTTSSRDVEPGTIAYDKGAPQHHALQTPHTQPNHPALLKHCNARRDSRGPQLWVPAVHHQRQKHGGASSIQKNDALATLWSLCVCVARKKKSGQGSSSSPDHVGDTPHTPLLPSEIPTPRPPLHFSTLQVQQRRTVHVRPGETLADPVPRSTTPMALVGLATGAFANTLLTHLGR